MRGRAHKGGDDPGLLLTEGMDEEEQVHNSLNLQLLQDTAENTE